MCEYNTSEQKQERFQSIQEKLVKRKINEKYVYFQTTGKDKYPTGRFQKLQQEINFYLALRNCPKHFPIENTKQLEEYEEKQRLEEQQRLEVQQRLKEQQRLEEQQRLKEQQRLEEQQRLIEEQQRQQEKQRQEEEKQRQEEEKQRQEEEKQRQKLFKQYQDELDKKARVLYHSDQNLKKSCGGPDNEDGIIAFIITTAGGAAFWTFGLQTSVTIPAYLAMMGSTGSFIASTLGLATSATVLGPLAIPIAITTFGGASYFGYSYFNAPDPRSPECKIDSFWKIMDKLEQDMPFEKWLIEN